MIDPSKNLIFINGENKTTQIGTITPMGRTYAVVFQNNSKVYNYSTDKIKWLKVTNSIDVEKNVIEINGFAQKNVKSVSFFPDFFKTYYFVIFDNGFQKLYEGQDVKIRESVLKDTLSKKVFEYLSEVAFTNPLKTEDGKNILSIQYQKIDEIHSGSALAQYLNPTKFKSKTTKCKSLIFPFGCNSSQYKAVRRAFENQLSVIQGPPGTGKTQTILNIIANILINNQSVIVVSNNNSATDNVLEKLKKYGLGFMAAPLGNSENKQSFLASQPEMHVCPDEVNKWKSDVKDVNVQISNLHDEISDIYSKKERLAVLKQELSQWELEFEHFKQANKTDSSIKPELTNAKADNLLELINFQQNIIEGRDVKFGKIKWFFLKLKFKFVYKINPELLILRDENAIKQTQILFYHKKISELTNEMMHLVSYTDVNAINEKSKKLSSLSMSVLKNSVYEKYCTNKHEHINVDYALKHNPNGFIKEFPIVLSTTFSALSSVKGAFYDYIIMYEASQITIETGALALACAHNAVIVGDTMQLPNVVTEEERKKLDAVIKKYDINSGYDSSKHSFLDSFIRIIPNVPQTLLREHYRCNPDIINFCNQKFYGGNLIIMTLKNNSKAVNAIKTTEGNHCRGHQNQREIDIICKDILPEIKSDPSKVGIIAPYNSQVNAIKHYVDNRIEVATVHKFQGREKDVIIMSVTDDQIGEFADNANLLNVAVSRAKQKFYLVVTGNKQDKHGNIIDLLDYIEYNGGIVSNSKICSIYDLLYKQFAAKREEFLKNRRKVSQYDSENLTFYLIKNILNGNDKFRSYDVLLNYPLNRLIGDTSLLNDNEKQYISHSATHVDFLIFSRVSKKTILTIEVDGWSFHHDGTKQSERDKMKNHILSLYNIPLLRLSTTGSNEKEIITEKLAELCCF
ncbi:MAG: AAA family ATPase [Bacteroidales bacterium]|nr:AAA family ATPase [Bacteroidales bacterium]